MKTPRVLLSTLLILGLFVTANAATLLLTDNFDGPTIDAAKWQTILPFGGSSVSQSGGVLTTTGRGILATVNEYYSPYVISGNFTMKNDLEHFNIAFRTNLAADGIDPFQERVGLFVSISNDGNEISIQRYTSYLDWDILAGTPFALNTGQAYTFSILDTGSFVSLAVNGVDLLSASTTYSTGYNVAFYSREFGGTGTAIDSVTITAVPEGGTTVAYLGIAGLLMGLGSLRRKPV